MEVASLIAIVVTIIVIYFFVKLIVSPIIKAIVGVIIFIVVVYVLQRLGFDFDQMLSPFGISLNLNSWITKLNWIFGPANHYIDQAKTFLYNIWQNFPKNISQ